MTTNKNEPVREMVMVAGLHAWERNPRGGVLRGIAEFAAVLQREGVREDLHCFMLNGVLTIMQGHRRKAACEMVGIPLVWIKNYGAISEREAFEILLSLQNGNDPFDARELALAARTAVHHMGMTAAEVATVFHRAEDTVQSYLDLETLSHAAQDAVWRGDVSLEIAGLLRQISTRSDQEAALRDILKDKVTGKPMSMAWARAMIEEVYLVPQRRAKKWADLIPLLRRKFKDAAQVMQFVAWEDREDFVMSEALPQSGYERVDAYIPAELMAEEDERMTWGELAAVYGVPIFIAPTMAAEVKHVCLVPVRAVKDADAVAEVKRLKGKDGKKRREERGETNPKSEIRNPNDEGEGTFNVEGSTSNIEETEADPPASLREFEFDVERWRRVLAVLMKRPEAVMADRHWKALEHAAWDAVGASLPSDVMEALAESLEADTGPRRHGMRTCTMALLAAVMAGGDEMTVAAVEEALGITG